MMAIDQQRYRKAALRFLTFTTPVFLAFFIVLWVIRYFGYDTFSNQVFIVSMVYLLGIQAVHYLLVTVKKDITKNYMLKMLWVLVYNNIVLFSYWLIFLDEARVYIYILAPMSSVSLFSVANFKQAAIFNTLQCICFAVCVYISELRINPESALEQVGIDWIYIIVYYIVSLWLSTVAETHAKMKKERDKVVRAFRDITSKAVESSVVDESAKVLSESGMRLLALASDQEKAVERLSTTVEELRATSLQNADLARSTLNSIKSAEGKIINSKADVESLALSMEQVKESGQEIQQINQLIDEISYQTNILSLNAMIEASRSGDEGGGFKVVALEVKKLAERSAKAAESINKLIEKNLIAIEQGVNISAQMNTMFAEISSEIQPVSSSVQSVSDASSEQSQTIEIVFTGLNEIEHAAQENKVLADETSEMAESLKKNSEILIEMVAKLDNF